MTGQPGRSAPGGGRARESQIADPGLAPAGEARIAWAQRSMPVLGLLRDRHAAAQPFAGRVIAGCLQLTPETAVLVSVLAAGGATVRLAASNPLSTQDDVAAALAGMTGVTVFARAGATAEEYASCLDRVLDAAPALLLDDGGDLTETMHAGRPELLPGLAGGCEATATGVARLRTLAAAGALGFPAVAADASVTRQLIDNGYGTGQSVLDGIIRATNTLVAGTTVVVAGYGPCGSAIASRAAGLGAQVVVTEVDAVAALRALLAGYRVLPMDQAAPAGDIFITATGSRDVITVRHMSAMRDGAILANAGHFDAEIDVAGLAAVAELARRGVREHADEYVLPGGRRLIVLAQGRVVNLVAAEGNPAAVMDLTFAAQVLALEWLASGTRRQPAGVWPMPAAIDAQVARLALAARGVRTDHLTEAQQEYLASWAGTGATADPVTDESAARG